VGRIPDEIIQQVRDRVDLVELVGRTVSLKRAGRSYKGLCPFHGEKTPSFHVNPDRGNYYCFGCQEGGDAFRFLMKVENLTFIEAVRSLARECGIEIPESRGAEAASPRPLRRQRDRARGLSRGVRRARQPRRCVPDRRGLAPTTPSASRSATRPIAGTRWRARSRPAACRVGRARRRDSAARERGPVTTTACADAHVPDSDARGRIIGFGGRALSEGQEPKYLNTPESPIFHKREAFYGLSAALAAIRRADRAVVVEVYFDRIALARAASTRRSPPAARALRGPCAQPAPAHAQRGAAVRRRRGGSARDGALARGAVTAGLRVRAALLPTVSIPTSCSRATAPTRCATVIDRAPDASTSRSSARSRAASLAAREGRRGGGGRAAARAHPVRRRAHGFAQRLALAVGTEVRHVEAAIRAASRGEDARDAVPIPCACRAADRKIRQLARSLVDHPDLAGRVSRERCTSSCRRARCAS
jgi:DNA primase